MALAATVDHAWLMRIASRRRVSVAGIVALLVGAAMLTGCNASSDQPLADLSLTVPVLWAARDSDGQMTGGVEQANVSVGDDGTAGYSVDLSGQAAKGAGPQWQAASASAAAVGTLYSGVDPSTVGVRFLVTGPIDGLSGGAMLSIGVLSALQHRTLLPNITMTGTVLPDGSVGRVSGVPTKIRAAAESGFGTVLIPLENARAGDASTDGALNMKAYGRGLGVNVIPVRDLLHAYSLLVGGELIPLADSLPDMSRQAQVVSQHIATRLVAATENLLTQPRPKISTQMFSEATAELAAAKSELKRANWTKAYAEASTTYRELTEQQTEAATRQRIFADGLRETSAQIVGSAREVSARLSKLEASATSDVALANGEHLSIATALAPVATAQAVLRRIEESSTSSTSDRAAVLAAGVAVAQSAATVDVFAPDQLAMATSAPDLGRDHQLVSTFMTGYTTFLTQAATANLGVTRTTGQPNGTPPKDDLEELALELQEVTRSHPVEDEGQAVETRQLGSAIAYYTTTVALPAVLDSQLFGSAAGNARTPQLRPVANEAVVSAYDIGAAFTTDLKILGIDPSFSVWLSQIAQEASSTAIDSDGTNVSGRAVIEAWNSVINSQTWRAFARLSSR